MTSSATGQRPARFDDAQALAMIHAAAWRGAYRGLLDGVDLERLVAVRGPRWWHQALVNGVRIRLMEVGGEPAGYASFGSCRIPGTGCKGEIYEFYLRPEYQGLGFGRELFQAVRHELQRNGMEGLAVRVLAENTPAVGFYQALGGKPESESWYGSGKSRLKILTFVWPARSRS